MQFSADHVLVAVEVRDLGNEIGCGLFLREPVEAGRTLVVFGGLATPAHQFRELPLERQHHALQVADDVFLVSGEQLAIGDYVNHSCAPSGVMIGEITLVAARDLVVGEQITYDYATTDSAPYDEFECACGEADCRGKVTGEDWMDPDIQQRYRGHFSPYLQRRIDVLRT